MKIDEYIRKYNSAKDKDKFLADSIMRQYIPYSDKIADCSGIVKASTELDGIFKINTPAQFMMFMIQIITRYTDIEKDENILGMFERLDELNLINAIISKVPEREITSYNTILNMVQDDYMENNRTLLSFFETKIQALGLSLDAVLDAMQKYIPQNETEVAEIEG